MTIPLTPKKKINEWARKPIVIGVLAGSNASVWGILLHYWIFT